MSDPYDVGALDTSLDLSHMDDGVRGGDEDFMGALDASNLDQGVHGPSSGVDGTYMPKMDDTWFTKDRMTSLAKSGQKAVSDMYPKDAAPSEMPKITPAAAVPLQMQQLQVKHGGLSAPLKTFRSGGLMRMPAPGGMGPTVTNAHRLGGPKLGIPHPSGRTMFADGGAMMPMMLSALNGIKKSIAATPPMKQRALQPGYQRGPGTGRSDSIHANLANGGEVATGKSEFVIPADCVSFIGDGSSEAGGEILNRLVKHLRVLHQKHLASLPGPRK